MAVKRLIKDFVPRLKKRKFLVGTLLVSLQSLSITAVLYWSNFFNTRPIESIVIIAAQLIIGMLVVVYLVESLTRPTRKIASAISHVSGELTPEKPPVPNDAKHVKSGLDSIIKKIYELSAENTPTIDEESGEIMTEEPPSGIGQGLLSKALEKTICGFVIMNKDREIVYANKAAPVRVDNDGRITLDIMFNEDNAIDEWWDDCEERAVNAEKTWSRVSNKMPGDEDRRIFDVLASYNKGDENEVVLMIVDRTKLYEVGEQELDFIAFAAHELRGPITVIKGYIDVLQDELEEETDNEQKELFNRLRVSANRLSGYINNILNTSKYDRRHLKMHLRKTTPAKVYDPIKDDMLLRARSQNRLLNVAIPEDIPTIAADRTSLGEVFANLIDNAIKYSNEGGVINVSATLNGEFVDISVQDFGIGMPGNVVGNLFQKFYRSHRSRETVAGTGIGLYISKAIVEAHGGTILVRSEEGKGSTFTVSLPTYRSIADKLQSGDNQLIINKNSSGSWIKNHSVFRG